MNNNKSKKRIAVRLAILMMALALITSCLAVGTLSKYTVGDNGADTAQVAKWGVRLTVTGDDDLFVDSYTGTAGKITVLAQDDYDLVAPGTVNTTNAVFTITGNPEVATDVDFTLGATKDVFLKYDSDDDGTKDATYYPVVFTLVHTYGANAWSIAPAVAGTGATVVEETGKDTITGTLAQIEAVLANLTASMQQVNPNYTYDDTFTLSWAWEFSKDAATDKLDTILGDLAAGLTVDGYTAADYCLDVAYDFRISVVQVD